MKTIITILGVIIIGVAAILLVGGGTADAPTQTATSTNNSATGTLEAAAEGGVYTIDSETSTVTWRAQKPLLSNYEDTGMIPVSDGQITVADQSITDGSITFNVGEITATETSNTSAGVGRLTNHLRSDDFLDVEMYPTASFTITDTAPVATTTTETDYQLTGDLTIKGQTNEITFPAEVGMSDDNLVVRGETEIDRSEWEIRYGSDSFFDNLGDDVIADDVEITIDLVANMGDETEAATSTNN